MKDFEWTEVERKEPDYSRFSIKLQEDIKSVSDAISYNRYAINILSELKDNVLSIEMQKRYLLFPILRQALYYRTIVEMHKVFNEKDTFSLPKIINKLINNYNRITWFSKPAKKELNRLKKSLTDSPIIKTVEKVKIIRDQYLAHKDRNPEKTVLALDEINFLQEFSEKLSNTIGNFLYGTSTGYVIQEKHLISGILLKLKAFDKMRELVLTSHKNSDKQIETEELLDLIRLRNIT